MYRLREHREVSASRRENDGRHVEAEGGRGGDCGRGVEMSVSQFVGAKIHRREDPRLVTGHGRYTDDLQHQGVLHRGVVPTPYAHASIRSIGVDAARKAPGVLAVYTAADFKDVIGSPATFPVAPVFAPNKQTNPPRYPIAATE